MTKRITVVMDDTLVKKLRIIQSKRIREEQSSVSFSRVLNDTLHKALK